MFIESSSFAASELTGTLAVGVGSATPFFFVIATPVGWVGLIVAAAAASMGMNQLVKDKSGGWYDNIINRVSTL